MAESGSVPATIECGYCLRKNKGLDEPKVLPCRHAHCLECLNSYYEINQLIQCPLEHCQEVFEVLPDTLPSYGSDKDNNTWCDTCMKKGTEKQPAVIYCKQCDKVFCPKHQESHDDALCDHPTITIKKYKTQSAKLQIRTCTDHVNEPLRLGCKGCLTLLCVKCATGLQLCYNGRFHELVNLDKLVAKLVDDDLRADIMAKEEMLEKLFKETSKTSSEFDVKTAEMVELLQYTRGAQLQAISEKYSKLEEELIQKRTEIKTKFAEFLDQNVWLKWAELRNYRLKIDYRLNHSHQVDIVEGFREMKVDVEKKLEENLPRLKLEEIIELGQKAECQNIELAIIPADDLEVGSLPDTKASRQLPQSLALTNTSLMRSCPLSVCQYEENTYVGLYNKTIARINRSFRVQENFINCSGFVESISVYKDRIYALLCMSDRHTRCVTVYDMSGKQVVQWSHPKLTCWSNVLNIVSDQVVVADEANKRITVFSLHGQTLKHVPCSLLGSSHKCMCSVDSESVIISDYSTSQVSRFNLTTGEVKWTYHGMSKPLGVSAYGSRCIVVIGFGNKTVQILDKVSGMLVSEVTDFDICGDWAYGLSTTNNMLILPKSNSKRLLFYQLGN